MITIPVSSDKMAISLSFLCAIHCMAMPLILILLPGLSTLSLDNEIFHRWILVAVIPTSIYALTMGCRKHRRFQFMILGILGLILLMIAAALGESLLGELYEKVLTMVGVSILAVSHFMNYRLCQKLDECECVACHTH